MIRLIFLPLLLLTILVANPAFSADFQKAENAYNKGDYTTALREWTPLAEQGDLYAQTALGIMYYEGKGIPQDYKAAINWFTLAAEQGIDLAQFNLGQMYRNGKGIPQDYENAAKWFTLAAEQGNDLAQNSLGFQYHLGRGVLQNYPLAHMWWNVSSSLGNEDSRKLRDIIAKQMSPTQIETAQRLARECVKNNYKGCGE
jgi:uncharacterized protein